jgi:hypothetical protein
MKNVHSPEQYLDIGFYYMIGAALQRRVWIGDLNNPVFPNQYVLLVGPAGVGKGLTTSPITSLLRHHKYKPGHGVIDDDDAEDVTELFDQKKVEDNTPLLFETAPDSASFEAIVQRMSKRCPRASKLLMPDNRVRVYNHASMHVALDEFTSVFKRHAEDTVSFFLTVWGDKETYERETIGRGREFIQHPCLSMIAGTTPDNLKKLTDMDIVGTGLSRRIVMVWAAKNRFEQMFIAPRDEEQNVARRHLLSHLRSLSRVCGPMEFTPEAREFLAAWWAQGDPRRACASPIVDDYEANRAIHIQKACMAFHFADSIDRSPITLATAQRALEFMQVIDRDRDKCLENVGRNPLSAIAQRITSYIAKRGLTTEGELLTMFYNEVQTHELRDILDSLRQRGDLEVMPHPKKGLGYVRAKQIAG